MFCKERVFEYESLAIFAGNTQIFSEIVFKYESGHFRGEYSKIFMPLYITVDLINTYFSGAFQQNIFSV